jgi:hypothetical protein
MFRPRRQHFRSQTRLNLCVFYMCRGEGSPSVTPRQEAGWLPLRPLCSTARRGACRAAAQPPLSWIIYRPSRGAGRAINVLACPCRLEAGPLVAPLMAPGHRRLCISKEGSWVAPRPPTLAVAMVHGCQQPWGGGFKPCKHGCCGKSALKWLPSRTLPRFSAARPRTRRVRTPTHARHGRAPIGGTATGTGMAGAAARGCCGAPAEGGCGASNSDMKASMWGNTSVGTSRPTKGQKWP